MEIEVGQEVEFVDLVETEEMTIERGTRARIGNIIAEVVEPTVTFVLLGPAKGGKILVNADVACSHCRVVQ